MLPRHRKRSPTAVNHVVAPHDVDADAAAEGAENLYWQLFRLASAFRRRDLAHISDGRLTLTQCSLLHMLDEHGAMRLTDIARADGVAPATISEAITRLERLGLVRRIRDTGDKRIYRIQITAEGRSQRRAASAGLVHTIMDSLDAEEIARLRETLTSLDKVRRAIDLPIPAPPGH